MCYNGHYDEKDSCSYISTELVGANINEYNDIMLNFSRPINLSKSSLSNSDLKITFRN